VRKSGGEKLREGGRGAEGAGEGGPAAGEVLGIRSPKPGEVVVL